MVLKALVVFLSREQVPRNVKRARRAEVAGAAAQTSTPAALSSSAWTSTSSSTGASAGSTFNPETGRPGPLAGGALHTEWAPAC